MKTPRARSAANGFVIAAIGIFTGAQADSGHEPEPSMAAAQLAPASLLKGPNHAVAERVRVERFMGAFELHSPYGTFRASGVEMLAIRVRELRAIEELRKVESSSAFTEALAKSASGTVSTVTSLVTEPGTTVENIATGAGTVLGRVGYSIKSSAQNVGDRLVKPDEEKTATAPGRAEPPSFTGDPLGYNKARREWAKQLAIDPYTTNPVLRRLLDNVASATFAGNFAAGATVGMVAAPLQYASDFESTVRDSVWNQPPLDLQKANEERLRQMGVTPDTVRAFLRNRWYTPTLQTALVAALQSLGGVADRDSVVRAATSVQGEVPARFLLRSVALLGDHHRKEAPLAKIRMRGIVPIGTAKDGGLVAAAAVDYLYWSAEAAAFAAARELAAPKRVLLVGGQASQRAADEFSRLQWMLRSGLRSAQIR
jgi:hypothetical protein